MGEDSDQGISYWAAGERIYPGHPDCPRRPERMNQPDFDCRVQTDDENGHIFTTEIDKENEEFSEKDSNDGNMIFFEEHSDDDVGPSSGDNWSNGTSSQADY